MDEELSMDDWRDILVAYIEMQHAYHGPAHGFATEAWRRWDALSDQKLSQGCRDVLIHLMALTEGLLFGSLTPAEIDRVVLPLLHLRRERIVQRSAK